MNWNLKVLSTSMKKLKNYLTLKSLSPKEGKRRDIAYWITLMLELRKNQKIKNLGHLSYVCCYFKVLNLNLVVFCCFDIII